MACPQCNDLSGVVPIPDSSTLLKIVLSAQSAIRAGVLTDVSQRYPFPGSPFAAMAASGSWDDHVNYHFECRHCLTVFHLQAETYHGSGGSWSPMPASAAS